MPVSRINEKNRLIADAELSKRHVSAALIAAIMTEIIAVVVLYVIRLPRSSPLRLSLGILGLIDTAAVAVVVGVLGMGFRTLTYGRKTIGDLRLEVAQLREAERDARSRMPAGSTTRLLWTYHSDVLTTIDEYRNSARGYRRVHNRFQMVIIIGSLMTTAISTAAVKYSSLEWAAVGVSFSVGVSAG
jgi:hypothetical protein